MSKKATRKKLQKRGVDAVERYLQLNGADVVERDWSCASGTLDLVATDGDALVFYEVETRDAMDSGMPSPEVTQEYRELREKLAMNYLSQNADFLDVPVRFDHIAVMVVASDRALVRHYVNVLGNACAA